MNVLNQANAEDFLRRFHQCYDGVIRSITVMYRSASRSGKARIVLSVRDSTTEIKEGWINLRLQLKQLQEWSMKESERESYQVLSNGLHIGFFGGIAFLDLGSTPDLPQHVEDFRQAACYFAAKGVEWEITPYEE